jgi:hypothetical protein
MRSGASTPEELESLFEDAFLIGDADALSAMFDPGAVLVGPGGANEARGSLQIARRAVALCDRGYSYVADPRRVLQARATALVVAPAGVNVMHRDRDGCWRYAISLLSPEHTT